MKYKAKPIIVDAYVITKFYKPLQIAGGVVTLEGGREVKVEESMLARYTPVEGDYLVVQPDGYVYLNPKAVFENKYVMVTESMPSGRIQVPDSSTIDWFEYEPTGEILTVGFKSGGAYKYPGVPVTTFEHFRDSESKGKYFAAEIKGKFEHEKQ